MEKLHELQCASSQKSVFTSLFVHEDDMEALSEISGASIVPKAFDACVIIPEGKHIWGDSGPWAWHRVFFLSEMRPILEHFNIAISQPFRLRFSDEQVLIAGHIEPLIIKGIRKEIQSGI